MKKLVILLTIVAILFAVAVVAASCADFVRYADIESAKDAVSALVENQPAPTDIEYSLERYNQVRRVYWVNGQREKAIALPCEIVKPLGYVVLFSSTGAIIQSFVVDGKVSYLGSYLVPMYEYNGGYSKEIPALDGCYGADAEGIFFFTTDGKYIEWTGDYLYSDIPFLVDEAVLTIEVSDNE